MTLTKLYNDLYDAAVSDVKGQPVDNSLLEQLEENPSIWYDALVNLKREVELQLTDKKRELHSKSIEFYDDEIKMATYKNEYNEWRVKVLRFMASIEVKIRQVKRLRAV